MPLRLHNTLTGQTNAFEPIEKGRVRVYVCGVTVYDLCHVGHARAFVAFDVLIRQLRASGYDVDFVRNITDIDDKIIDRARQEGVPATTVAERNVVEFHRDVEALGCLVPDHEPRATEYIDEMVSLVERLIERELAYAVDGDVYYSVTSFEGYGKLSGRKLDEMMAGSRVEVDPRKRHPMDFALWKSVPEEREKSGEPAWPSPWGRGRPGWHLECSAMSTKLLGQPFDIHGGGEDLVFPHHENEIAQSEGVEEKPLARWFLHNSFVRWREEKMSKSLGNVFSIREIAERLPAEALRLFLIATHYRSPLDFSTEGLEETYRGLVRIYETLARVDEATGEAQPRPALQPPEGEALTEFRSAMDDDLNTARAVGVVFEMIREMNRLLDAREVTKAGALRKAMGPALAILGVGVQPAREFLDEERSRWLRVAGLDREDLAAEIRKRAEARKERDFGTADAVRDELARKGIVLEDRADGTEWRPVAWGAEARPRKGDKR